MPHPTFLDFTEACKKIQSDPEAGWKAIIDVNWTLSVMHLITHRMLYALPELVFSTLNQTMMKCPSSSAAATLTDFYVCVYTDPGITPRVMRALTYYETQFMKCIPRAWISESERAAAQRWKEAHRMMTEKDEISDEVPESIREIWNRLPLLITI